MLTERQLLILQVIVDDFIRSAQPVGSRTLSKKDEIRLSSATIRNEMADLEEKGYIEKTHTSSGRVPSQKGYRFYVDHLISPLQLSPPVSERVRELLQNERVQLERLVESTANLLSDMTNYTAIVLGPKANEQTLKRIQIIPISNQTAVLILVTNSGHVQNEVITLPKGIEVNELEKFVNIINSQLLGTSISRLSGAIAKETFSLLEKHLVHWRELLEVFTTIPQISGDQNIMHISGKTKMLHQPEFTSIEKIRTLLDMMEGQTQISEILRLKNDGVKVSIGKENKISPLDQCSLITATYDVDSINKGTIAILGPTRMEYSKVIPLLYYFSNALTTVLNPKD